MNETDVISDVDRNKICRACLRSNVDLIPMAFELKNWYQSFVDKTANQDSEMMICIICNWIFTKLVKFIQQCKTANEILNEALLTDKKPRHIQHAQKCHNFMSQTYLHSTFAHSPAIEIKSEKTINLKIIEDSNNDCNDFENSSHQNMLDSQQCLENKSVIFYENNTELSKSISQSKTNNFENITQHFETIFENRQQHKSKGYNQDNLDSRQSKLDSFDNSNHQFEIENRQQEFQSKNYNQETRQSRLDSRQSGLDSFENSKQQFETGFENSNEQYTFNEEFKVEYSGDEFQTDDDVPLVMMKSDERKKKKRKRKIKDQSPERDSKPKVRCKKGTKQLKEGFSSRMVQETKEYIVIKLNREQVLNEMEQRSKTEEYLRYPYKCEKCVKGFNFDDVLQSHMEKHVADNGSFQCDMCYQYCPSAVSLRGHIKSHTTRYKCKLCGQVRLARQHLLEHYTNTHSNQPITYKCESCDFTTDKRTVMQRHVRSHNNSSLHACHKCGKLYKNMETLRVHTTIHDKSRFQCKLCSATFVYQTLLKRHELSVHQRRDFYCVECDVEFKTKISLNLHFKRSKKHRDSSIVTNNRDCQKPVECSMCLRSYSNRDTLRAHVYRAHKEKGNIEVHTKPKEESYENKIEV